MADIFSWEFDAPTGVYKNHQLSRRLWEQAVAETKFMEFVDPMPDYGRGMGESVTLTRIKSMTEPDDATLIEGVRIPEDEFSLSTRPITVTEIGRAVPYTSLSQDLSAFDLVNPIQRKLMEQLRLTLDTSAANAFRKARLKYAPTSATGGTLTTNGSITAEPGTAADGAFKVRHVGDLRDFLFDRFYVEPWSDGDYVMLARTRSLRSIKNDSDWEKWHQYVDPSNKFNGEVGRLDSTRFVEVNHHKALGQSSTLGEGFVFGRDAVALAEVLTPELRVAQPDDFGRSRAVAWYGILAFDIIWETGNQGEAKIIHVTNGAVSRTGTGYS